MKAIVITNYGPPDDIEIKEAEKPILNDNEALVKIYAASVNYNNLLLVKVKPVIDRCYSFSKAA